MLKITRKSGEWILIGKDLVVRVIRTGATVTLQLIGAFRGTRVLRRGQVTTIGDQVAIRARSMGMEPELEIFASFDLPIVRGELTERDPTLVEGLQAELQRRAQQRQQEASPASRPNEGVRARGCPCGP